MKKILNRNILNPALNAPWPGIAAAMRGYGPFLNRVLNGGAAASFSPANVSGIQQWLKADALTGLNDNDPVTTWTDSSTNNKNATQATAGLKPLYKTNVVNGKPVVRFDGTGDHLLQGDFSALTAGEIFVVLKINADPPAALAQCGLWSTNTESALMPFTDGTIYDSWGSTTRQTTVNPTTSLASAFAIYSVHSAASDWSNYLNGTLLFNTATNTVTFSATCYLGRNNDNSLFLAGDVAELIKYNAKLSTGNRTSVINYLKTEYGIV